jgi:hypothetical protein
MHSECNYALCLHVTVDLICVPNSRIPVHTVYFYSYISKATKILINNKFLRVTHVKQLVKVSLLLKCS